MKIEPSEIIRRARQAEWQWLRQLGFWHYVLRYGVGPGIGVLLAIILTGDIRSHSFSWWLAIVGTFGLGGFLCGCIGWSLREKKYRSALSLESP
jgi:hypothetical protein